MPPTNTPARRPLGPNGPQVPPIALGSWNTWDRTEFDDAVAMIHRAVELGYGFFDVAHYNMGPHAEDARTDLIFGQAIRATGLPRDAWLLCGKLWLWEYPTTGFDEQLTRSLDRIGVDRADLVVVGDYFGELDIERVVTDVAEQIAKGRFEHWGVNNWPYADVRAAIDIARKRGLTPPAFAQLKYGLARRSMAEGPYYAKLFADGELGLQASDVFEGGILVGNSAPQRKIGADVGSIREQIIASYPRVQRIADELGASPAQLGIAFCLSYAATGNVLVGASRMSQLEDNVGAIALLDRVGADTIRDLTAELWIDRDVAADGTW